MALARIESCEEKFQEIRMHLEDYLLSQGLDVRNGRRIKCINPDHDDQSPSMSSFETEQGNPAVHCFSCGFSADIFQAAHAIENKPIMGPSFIEDNVLYLAEKYDIEIPKKILTEEEIYELNTYQAYAAAAEYISKQPFGEKQHAEVDFRGWTKEFCNSFQIGACPDFPTFRAHLKGLGFSAKFLDEVDLGNDKIFHPDNLIFTVCDDYGRPVGFAARNLRFDGVKDERGILVNGAKFNNTKTTGVKCNIYRKSERLYLLHEAKKNSPPLYIFEGYGDALTAQHHGMSNSSAIGALELSTHHLNTCRRNGIYDVVICLDGDSRGHLKAKALIDEVLNTVHDIKVRFIFLDEQEMEDEDGNTVSVKVDPDIFIRENGVEAFLALPKINPFTWRLREFEQDDSADPESICFAMIPIIAGEPSAIKVEGMVKELSEFTGYSDKVIKSELEKIKNTEEAKFQRSKDAIVEDLVRSLQEKKDSVEILLTSTQDKLYNIEKEHRGGMFDTNTLINDALSIKNYAESAELHQTVLMGNEFRTLQSALSGDLRGKFVLVGGTANTGKTTKFCNLGWNIAKHNKDAICIMLTIDDSSKELVPRLITFDIADRTYASNRALFDVLTINKIASPYLFVHTNEYQAIMEEREVSFKNYLSLIRDNKLVVLDSEKGSSIDFIASTVKHYAQTYPDKHIFMFVDNFHLVSMPGYDDGRLKYKNLSNALKQVAVQNDATVISTVEYTKIPQGQKPSNSNLAETVQLEYDSNCIMHMYSELHDIREKSGKYFLAPDGETKWPIIEEDVGKNKINSYKGTIYYRFYPEKAFYSEISADEAKHLEAANKDSEAAQAAAEKEMEEMGPVNRF